MISNWFKIVLLHKRKKLLISYNTLQICKHINRGVPHMYSRSEKVNVCECCYYNLLYTMVTGDRVCIVTVIMLNLLVCNKFVLSL